MAFQTLILLEDIWDNDIWRDNLLSFFDKCVQENISRTDAKREVKKFIEIKINNKVFSPLHDIDLKQVNWDQYIEFLCLCFYGKRFHSPLLNVPSEEMWKTLIDAEQCGPLSLHPQPNKPIKDTVPVPLFPLEQKLIAYGGKRMVYRQEPDLNSLLERGEIFEGPIEFILGASRACHTNSAHLWNESRESLDLATGYALSEDGLWRQHSWVLLKQPLSEQVHIIETTISRIKYFGFILTNREAEEFFQSNI